MKQTMIARGLVAAFADAGNTAPDVGALLAELNSSFAAFKDSKEKEIAALQQGSEEAKASSAKTDFETRCNLPPYGVHPRSGRRTCGGGVCV